MDVKVAEMLCTQVCSRVPRFVEEAAVTLVAHVGGVLLEVVPRTSGTSSTDQSYLAPGLQDYRITVCIARTTFHSTFKAPLLCEVNRASVTLIGL